MTKVEEYNSLHPTAEAMVKHFGGTTSFSMAGTVASFHRWEDRSNFLDWMQKKGCYEWKSDNIFEVVYKMSTEWIRAKFSA